MKFTDTFINSFNDGFMKCYVGTVSNTYIVYTNMEDILSVEDIEVYFDFLNILPSDKHIEISRIIWRFIFILKVVNPYLKIKNKHILENRGTQNKQNKIRDSISKDLNDIKKFKVLINKIFTAQDHTQKGKNILRFHTQGDKIIKLGYSVSGDSRENDTKLYNIEDLFEIVDLIINDLQTQEFKFISDKNYYLENIYSTKEDFKKYLIDICKKNSINKYTDNINHLLDNLF